MGGIIVASIVVFCIFAAISYNMALNMQEIVEKKGYKNLRVVALCFWLGIIGYLYVIALPNLEEQRMLKKIAGEAEDVIENEEKEESDAETVETEIDEEKEQIYSEAIMKMQRGSGYNSVRFYNEAVEMFEKIAGYRDSDRKMEECRKEISKIEPKNH